jgi:hypothetical protein
MEINHGPQV